MKPVEAWQEVGEADFVKMRRVLRRKRDDVAGVKVCIRDQGGGLIPRRRERTFDGVTVTNLSDGFAFSSRLLDWVESEEAGTSGPGSTPLRYHPIPDVGAS